MRRLFRRILDVELPTLQPISTGVRLLLLVLLLLLSVQVTRESLFKGGDSDAWSTMKIVTRDFSPANLPTRMFSSAGIRQFFDVAFVPLLLLCAAIRFGIIFFGPLLYERTLKTRFPVELAVVMCGLNVFSALASHAVLVGIGMITLWAGYGYQLGSGFIGSADVLLHQVINDYVPNLIQIPYPLPLLAAEIPAGLGYYWFHRLQHTWRPLWLFTHRVHHFTTHVTVLTTGPANDRLGFALAPLTEGLFLGIATRLFSSEAMIAESILFSLLTFTASEAFNHNEPTYSWTIRGPLRRFWFHFTGWGAYHLVHHSAAEEHRLANIGGGPFMLWDRVFGTYYTPPEQKPSMGLTGRPAIYMNPVRIALAGYLEVATELRRNSTWRDWLKILFGSADYVPPVHVPYLIKSEAAATGESLRRPVAPGSLSISTPGF